MKKKMCYIGKQIDLIWEKMQKENVQKKLLKSETELKQQMLCEENNLKARIKKLSCYESCE